MDANKIPVRSRTEGMVSYRIESLRVLRSWPSSGKVLYVPLDELKELMVIPGGEYLLRNSLIIEDPEARIEVLGNEQEPEYDYTEDEIKYLLYEAEDNALLDCLDYAPKGVLALIRSFALEKMPNTTAKTQAINEKFGIDLAHMTTMFNNTEEETEEVKPTSARRTAPVSIPKKKYNVVKTNI